VPEWVNRPPYPRVPGFYTASTRGGWAGVANPWFNQPRGGSPFISRLSAVHRRATWLVAEARSAPTGTGPRRPPDRLATEVSQLNPMATGDRI